MLMSKQNTGTKQGQDIMSKQNTGTTQGQDKTSNLSTDLMTCIERKLTIQDKSPELYKGGNLRDRSKSIAAGV